MEAGKRRNPTTCRMDKTDGPVYGEKAGHGTGGKPCHCTVRKAKEENFMETVITVRTKFYSLLLWRLAKQNVWKAKNCNPGKNYVRGQQNQHGMLGMRKECHGRNLRLEALWRNGIC